MLYVYIYIYIYIHAYIHTYIHTYQHTYTHTHMQFPTPEENGRGGCVAADISKLVATLLVVAGSTIVAAAIGIFAEVLLNSPGGWYKTLIRDKEFEKLWAEVLWSVRGV